jgi:hypothetical protein
MTRRLAWLLAAALAALGTARALRAEDAPPPDPSAHRRNAEQLRERLQRLRERAAELASAAPSASSAPPLASALNQPASAVELARRWAALAATRHERRARHRAELLDQIGERLDDPAARAELELNARRLAELGRIEFLAQNARDGAARTQLLARVAKLRARELERRKKRLLRLTAAAPSISPAAPAPPPSAEARP